MIKKLLLAAISFMPAVLSDAAPVAKFHSFEYRGEDQHFAWDLPPRSYYNPVMAGFAADPGIVRVGEWVYLVNSSFAFFPGVPIHRSKDLVHWEAIGHILDRPDQVSMEGLGVSRGIFAPAIEYHDGTFYMATTLVDGGGNFFVTATDPAGPWSDPVWMPEIEGIDPSFFFDDDGRAWILNNGNPPNDEPLYEGHRAIWLQEFDVAAQKPIGPRKIIINGGVDLSQKPIWIEGPHIFRRGNWYYLTCAEGGTAEDHRQVIFRSKSVEGPWIPWEHNPILTQRDLDPNRPLPITSVGHADFVEMPDGSWWATFLGCRPYKDGYYYNTGRETFLLPVTWVDDWPVILPAGQTVPTSVLALELLPEGVADQSPQSGNLTWTDSFTKEALDPFWIMLRTGRSGWLKTDAAKGILSMEASPIRLDTQTSQPSFIGRRQQHIDFTSDVVMELPEKGASAGIVAFQSETYHYYMGVQRNEEGIRLFLEKAAGGAPEVVAEKTAALPSDTMGLRIVGNGAHYSFFYSTAEGEWLPLLEDADGTILSTRVAGGFVGVHLGMHARVE